MPQNALKTVKTVIFLDFIKNLQRSKRQIQGPYNLHYVIMSNLQKNEYYRAFLKLRFV